MKKVIYFIPTFPNLSETFILREVVKLVEFGNLSIHIFSFKKGNAQIPSILQDKISYLEEQPKPYLEALGFAILNIFKIFKIAKLLFTYSDTKNLKNLYLLSKAVLYAPIFKKIDFDQIHSHFLSDISSMILLVGLLLDKPVSISAHATDVFKNASLVSFKVKFSQFIAVCNSLAYNEILRLSGGKGRKNVLLQYHGIDPQSYPFKVRDLEKKNLRIITDARFVPKKGLKILSDAIIELIRSGHSINFTIIGVAQNDPQLNLMHEIVKIFVDQGFSNNLNIPGSGKGVSQKQVALEYQEADLFIYAGIDDQSGDVDGIPNALLQAGFCGLPVMTTQSGSIKELFDDSNSLIIEQKNSQDIIIKFKDLVSNSDYQKRSHRLFQQVYSDFNLDLNVKLLENELLK